MKKQKAPHDESHPDPIIAGEMTAAEAEEAGHLTLEKRIERLQKLADIGRFCEVYSTDQLHAVQMFCYMFNVRLDHAAYISGYLRQLGNRQARTRHFQKEEGLQFLDENCLWCNAQMQGGVVPSCETKRTKRVSYKECTECDHYCEKFETGENLYKIICYPWEGKVPGHKY